MNIIKFNNSILKYSGKWLETDGTPTPVDPYNPLNLPPNVVRVRTNDGEPPIKAATGSVIASYETATKVVGTSDVYDVYKSGTDFTWLLYNCDNVIEVLGANTTNVTKMQDTFNNCNNLTTISLFDTSNVTDMLYLFCLCPSLVSVPLFDTSKVTNMDCMFFNCLSLPSIPLFDTSNVTSMYQMFESCTALTSIPLFNTSKVTNMDGMFAGCAKVESGALALYQQASSQTNPPVSHYRTFYHCGRNTITGAAELAQIPSDWKE